MWNKRYFVYILANESNKVLYIGVTNDIKRRVHEHKIKLNKGFTYKYNVDKLVYFEEFTSILAAIKREKQMKKWNRVWKEELIEGKNPCWRDLYEDI